MEGLNNNTICLKSEQFKHYYNRNKSFTLNLRINGIQKGDTITIKEVSSPSLWVPTRSITYEIIDITPTGYYGSHMGYEILGLKELFRSKSIEVLRPSNSSL